MAHFTIITDTKSSKIIGGSHGQVGFPPGTEGMSGGLVAGPGQELEHVGIPDEIAEIKDVATLHARLSAHLSR
jgi:hypothetical protein